MAQQVHYMREGDLEPAIVATLKDGAGTAVDLTGETVRFHMTANLAGTAKVDAAATIIDAAAGRVRYTWQSGDTDTPGTFYAEFEVESGPQTYPNGSDWIQVKVSKEVA